MQENKFSYLSPYMKPIRICAVSYYNTLPLIYGIRYSGLLTGYELELKIPSLCAERLLKGEADLSLVPVGALPSFQKYQLLSNYCIGAVGKVTSVLLLANSPVNSLHTIYLDTHSRTSVNLVRVLAKRLWNINVEWKSLADKDPLSLEKGEGVVLIGDKTFGTSSKFGYCYDLAEAWFDLTGLPFVFAAWVTTSPLPETFVNQFNAALHWGVNHRKESMSLASNLVISQEELLYYLENDISFELDEAKKKGLDLFLSFLKEDQAL